MNRNVIGIAVGITALVLAVGAWAQASAKFSEMGARLSRLDALGAVRGDLLSERLIGTEEAIVEGEERDTGFVQRIERVEGVSGRATELADRVDLLEEQLAEAVRVLENADDQNVYLVQSYQEQLDELQRAIDWMDSAWESLPLGAILPWLPESGAEIPPGWAICNGYNGTPDLRGLFLRGVGDGAQAGLYYAASTMGPAGLHAHDNSSPNHSRFGMNWGATAEIGDARAVFDTDILAEDEEIRASHGEHVHFDENLPQHATVLYIIKLEHAG